MGTIWLTSDQCNGTLFKVRRGVVTVTDFVLDKTVSLPGRQDLPGEETLKPLNARPERLQTPRLPPTVAPCLEGGWGFSPETAAPERHHAAPWSSASAPARRRCGGNRDRLRRPADRHGHRQPVRAQGVTFDVKPSGAAELHPTVVEPPAGEPHSSPKALDVSQKCGSEFPEAHMWARFAAARGYVAHLRRRRRTDRRP